MRHRNLANLPNYFHRSAGCLNGRFGFIADRIHFESDLGRDLPVAQDLYFIGLADQPVDVKVLEGELADIVFTGQLLGLADIEYFILNPVRVLETSFGDPALNWHLAAFMRHFSLVTGPALSALITFCGCTSVPGSFTTA